MTSLPTENLEKEREKRRENPENLAAGKLAASWQQPTGAHPAAAPTVAAARFRLLSRQCKRVSAGCAYKTSSTAAAAVSTAVATVSSTKAAATHATDE